MEVWKNSTMITAKAPANRGCNAFGHFPFTEFSTKLGRGRFGIKLNYVWTVWGYVWMNSDFE